LSGVSTILFLKQMLRLQRFKKENALCLKRAFDDVFDNSELPYFEDFQNCGMGPSFVGIDRAGIIQAFILVRHTPLKEAAFEIAYLGVSNRYKRKGYGERLIELVKGAVGKGGVWLNVFDSNVGACALYKKLGFEELRRFSTETDEVGILFVSGIKCWHCDTSLAFKDVIVEDYPVRVVYTEKGFSRVEEKIRICWNCRTRVES